MRLHLSLTFGDQCEVGGRPCPKGSKVCVGGGWRSSLMTGLIGRKMAPQRGAQGSLEYLKLLFPKPLCGVQLIGQ